MAQATHSPKTDAPQRDSRPQCDVDIVETGCEGPPPTPWLSWKHCFRVYEFREILLGRNANAAELWAWLEAGAHFYVCGDASRMAKDVDAALHKAIETAGGKSAEQAAEYVAKLKSDKRYQRDVY